MNVDLENGPLETASDPVKQALAIALDPLGVLRRRWIWMSIALATGLVATAGLIATVTPTYEATASVLVSSQQIPEEFVRSTVSGLDSLSNINALVGEVLAQRSLTSLVEKYELYPMKREKMAFSDVVDGMREDIRIKPQRQVDPSRSREDSTVFIISFEYPDAVVASKVANDLASSFINASIAKRSEQARHTTEFLKRELVRSEQELREINREIAEFQREHRGELPGDQETALRKLERLELQRQSLATQISAAEERLIQLEKNVGEMSSPQQMLMELRMQLASELGIHTDEHPNVVALRRRIERMENELSEVTSLLEDPTTTREERMAAARRELKALRDSDASALAEIRELDSRVARMPDNQEKMKVLEQRSEVARDAYLEFLHKVQDAELAQTLESTQQGPHVSFLDRAGVPASPIRSPISFLVPGVLVSLLLTLGLGAALELLDPVVISADQFEDVGGPSLLGSVHRLA